MKICFPICFSSANSADFNELPNIMQHLIWAFTVFAGIQNEKG